MSTTTEAPRAGAGGERWYAMSAQEVAQGLGVDPAKGLSAAKAAEVLASHGPNALPTEKPKPGWQRFLDEYRTLHADHPGRRGHRVAADPGVEHGASCCSC